MALDTLWAAVWVPPDVALVCTGWKLHGQRSCPACTELHYWRCHWRVYPGLAANRGGMAYFCLCHPFLLQKIKAKAANRICCLCLNVSYASDTVAFSPMPLSADTGMVSTAFLSAN